MIDSLTFRERRKKIQHTFSFFNKKLIHLNLQILYDCNFRCKICDFWKNPGSSLPRLSIPQIQIISDKIRLLRPQIIVLGGGEPLLHENLIEITKILSENNFLMMVSNGWLMTPEIARTLWQAGMNQVLISLDYADPEKHDRMRGRKDAFRRAKNALIILHENRTQSNQRVQIISTILDDNFEEIETLICLSKELGVTLIVSLYCKCRGNIKYQPISRDLTTSLLELKKKYRNFVSLRGYLSRFSEAVNNGNGIQPCYAGKNLFNINCQGDVSVCIDHIEDPVGNILSDNIFEIENRLMEKHVQNNCGLCWTSCRGPVETLMYGNNKLSNFLDYHQFSRQVALNQPF
jgi:MoaA/NifB/PqqE/SkfB family radical SAM enzyme